MAGIRSASSASTLCGTMPRSQTILDLTGRRALVTGGSRGIGAATSRLLAAAGADVMIGYKTRDSDAEQVATDSAKFGVRACTHPADLSHADGAAELVQATIAQLGGIDIFVANAGIWPEEEVELAIMNPARWHRTVRENLDSIFFSSAAVAKEISAGGRAPRDVTLNCVAPRWVDTKMVAGAIACQGLEQISRGIPLGRIASPEDIAGPIVFLCSSLARHVTGEILNVNGGSVLCG